MKNRRKQVCRVPHGQLAAKKWLDSIEKQKRSNLKECDRQTDGQTESTTTNNRLLAWHGDQ